MKLFLLERTDDIDYDEYNAFVVAAHGLEDALHVPLNWGDWSFNARCIRITEIGIAKDGTERGAILGSFNAG